MSRVTYWNQGCFESVSARVSSQGCLEMGSRLIRLLPRGRLEPAFSNHPRSKPTRITPIEPGCFDGCSSRTRPGRFETEPALCRSHPSPQRQVALARPLLRWRVRRYSRPASELQRRLLTAMPPKKKRMVRCSCTEYGCCQGPGGSTVVSYDTERGHAKQQRFADIERAASLVPVPMTGVAAAAPQPGPPRMPSPTPTGTADQNMNFDDQRFGGGSDDEEAAGPMHEDPPQPGGYRDEVPQLGK